MSSAGIAAALPPAKSSTDAAQSQASDYYSKGSALGSEVKTGIAGAMKDFEGREEKADELEKSLDPNALTPPQLKPPPVAEETSAIKEWGSAAMAVAALGGLFTRQPLTNSLNAAAGVLNAYKARDAEAAKTAYDTWKVANDNAIEAAKWTVDVYKTALDQIKTDRDGGKAELLAVAGALKDETVPYMLQHYGVDATVKLISNMESNAAKMEAAAPKIDIMHEQHQNAHAVLDAHDRLKAAQQTGDKTKIAAAQADLQDALQRSQEYNASVGKGGAAGATSMGPDDLESYAGQAATGMPLSQVVPGYGSSAMAVRSQVHAAAVKQIMAENPGMSAKDAGGELANRAVEYAGGKKSIGQLETMVGATKQAVGQLDFNVDKVTEEMKKLRSSDISPVINAIERGEEKWTGDPAYFGLFYYMHAAAVESARILSGGQASTAQLHQGAMEQAQQWANVNMTPSSWGEVATSMKQEGRNRLGQYQQAAEYQSGLTGGGGDNRGTNNRVPSPSKLDAMIEKAGGIDAAIANSPDDATTNALADRYTQTHGAGAGAGAGGAKPKPPQKGAVENGYQFLGGDPSKQSNWRKAAAPAQ